MACSRLRTAIRLLPVGAVISCQSESTAPPTQVVSIAAPTLLLTDNVVASVAVTPDSQMAFAGDKFKVTAKPKNAAGQLLTKVVRWTVLDLRIVKPLDSLKATVPFKALKAGVTSIRATVDGKAQLSKVVVRSTAGGKVVVTPATATLSTGGTVQFVAGGLTAAGEKLGVNVTWNATGGTISSAGVLKAGTVPGSYQVIATSKFGAKDTSAVTITSAPTPVTNLTLLPSTLASRPGAVTRFVASAGGSSTGLSQPVNYTATCGAITSQGVYTAPPADNGSCRVIASSGNQADTTEVRLLRYLQNGGSPFGLFALWTNPTTTAATGIAPFTASHGRAFPDKIISQISAARSKGIHLVLAMTGGEHTLYKTDGVFDMAKWQAAMDQFNTPALRDAVADGVADGTIIGNSVMDEPHQSDDLGEDRGQSWGPKGTMTRARVDGLCAYVKSIFPTLPVGVFHDALAFDPNNTYQVCEFFMTPYGARKGSVTTWRDAQLAQARNSGMSVIFSLNIVNGGKQDKTGTYDCAGTGGLGSYFPNCSMTPEQIQTWGRLLAPEGCALFAYRYDGPFLDNPANQAALSDVSLAMTDLPYRPCTGSRTPNAPPTPLFAFQCGDLACSFTESSFDSDGQITEWSWDFGDGGTSGERQPSHTYASAGTYQVVLSVTDDDRAPASVTHSVTVVQSPPPNQPPVASFTSDCNDLGCSFTDQSADQDGTLASWTWTFGDGVASTDQSPTHTFDQAGTYEIELVVTDDDGDSDTVTQSVVVPSTQQEASGSP